MTRKAASPMHAASVDAPQEARLPAAYFTDDDLTLYNGDACKTLSALPSGSADCVVTSPPYYGLRDYGVPGQLGTEADPDLYVRAIADVLRQLRRVLAADGTLWLNLGDSYHQKSLLGIPWRVMLAARGQGWLVRNSIVWHKTNAMPESVSDRLGGRHEVLFLLTRSPRYHFDLDAIRVPHNPETIARAQRAATPYEAPGQTPNVRTKRVPERGANPGDVWAIPNTGYRGAHFATFPLALPTRCIAAGCKPGGVVLDPFCGAGTTGVAALEAGRGFIGIDINADYCAMAAERLRPGQLPVEAAS